MRVKKILVPTDFSEAASHAVAQATELAMAQEAELHLLHVVESHHDEPATGVSTLVEYLEKLQADAQTSLAMKVDVLRGNDVDVFYETSREPTPFDGIVERVRRLQPDLIVMGTHGRTGLSRLLVGSVAEKVLRHVDVRLLTLSPKAPLIRASHAFERILVPVDFSDCSKRAVESAAALLVEGGTMDVVHVVASPVHPSFYAAGISSVFEVDPELPARIDARLSEWLEGLPIAARHVREGDILYEVDRIRGETNSQLIVMGTHGLSGLDHLLVGSVAEKMVRTADIPVLTVH